MSSTDTNNPDNLRYSKEHEWIRLDGEHVYFGITEYAAEQLGDVVHVDLPQANAEFGKGEAFGTVESVKSVSDVFSPVSCKIIEINEALEDNPGIINHDPYGEGWIVKAEATDPAELDGLMTAAAYIKFLSEEA